MSVVSESGIGGARAAEAEASNPCPVLIRVAEYMEDCRSLRSAAEETTLQQQQQQQQQQTGKTQPPPVHVAALLTACEMLIQRGYQVVSFLDNREFAKRIERAVRESAERSSSWVRFAPIPPEAHAKLLAAAMPEFAAAAEGWSSEEKGPAIVAEVPHPKERARFTSLHARSDLGGSEHLWVYYEHKPATQSESTKGRATSVSVENTRTLAHEILTSEQNEDEPRPHRVLFLTAKGVTASAAEPLREIGIEVESWKFAELVRNPSRHILWTHVAVLDNYWDLEIQEDLRKGEFFPGRGPVEPMTRMRVDPLDLPVLRSDDKVARFYGLVEGSVVCRIAISGYSQGFFQMRRVPIPFVDEHRRFLKEKKRAIQATVVES